MTCRLDVFPYFFPLPTLEERKLSCMNELAPLLLEYKHELRIQREADFVDDSEYEHALDFFLEARIRSVLVSRFEFIGEATLTLTLSARNIVVLKSTTPFCLTFRTSQMLLDIARGEQSLSEIIDKYVPRKDNYLFIVVMVMLIFFWTTHTLQERLE